MTYRSTPGEPVPVVTNTESSVELASIKIGGSYHHIPGTAYHWKHGWKPLDVWTALRWGKKMEADRLHREGAEFYEEATDVLLDAGQKAPQLVRHSSMMREVVRIMYRRSPVSNGRLSPLLGLAERCRSAPADGRGALAPE